MSPAAGNPLFMVNDDAAKLPEGKADVFHSVTAKLLYIEKRARPDIKTAISFLTTSVQSPDTNDQKKLRQVLTFLSNTIDDVRKIKFTTQAICRVDGEVN